MADVRLMVPMSRTALPRWEVSTTVAGVIGWVQESKIGRTTRRFFHAYGVHPVTAKAANLENYADLEQAVAVVEDFHYRPGEYARFIL